MIYEVEIREIPEHIVYYKEYFIEDLNAFFQAMQEDNFLQTLSDRVLEENPEIGLTDPDYNVILFADGTYGNQHVRIEFCDAVTAAGRDTNEYRFRTVEGFTALNIRHRGPYCTVGEAYGFAERWMRENGYRQVGCPRNSAIDGFWNKESEADYLTEVQIPVKKANSEQQQRNGEINQ